MSIFDFSTKKAVMPGPGEALPGRETAISIESRHQVLGTSMTDGYPADASRAMFGMGCFWGVERLFWQQKGVYTTSVGYSGGITPNPTYEEVCSGLTGHNEVVLVVFRPAVIRYQDLLRLFWENHYPTQGMRQGNDRGTQYRSGIYWFEQQQKQLAEASRERYQIQLAGAGVGDITTEVVQAGPFYFAETCHQQYLAKNPGGYCNLQRCDASGLPGLDLSDL